MIKLEKLNFKENNFNTSNLIDMLYKEYVASLKNDDFKKLVNKLKLKDEVAMKYTSKLERTVKELNNCKNCKNLFECKNEINGCIYYPNKNSDSLDFNYVACKYKNKELEALSLNKSTFFGMNSELKKASMSNIDINDKNRIEIIKWLKNFYDEFPQNKKGLFLHGSFGSGKTYLISALFNELSKKKYNAILIYFPEMLSKLKGSFDNKEDGSFNDLMNDLKTSDLLLIDDIGAETVTNWSRDEILGTILQYRMENNLSTFFTSNLNINELENHLTISKNSVDKVKARRIIERIKQLTVDIELISANRRK